MRRLKVYMPDKSEANKLESSQLIEEIYAKAKAKKAKVVLPEGEDIRTLQAARRIQDSQLAQPIVLGNEDELVALAKTNNIPLSDIELINPETSNKVDEYAERYAKRLPCRVQCSCRKLATTMSTCRRSW